jgi:tRNA 5-methylaminomethyl-2-thiouridine biosynthesis bifunctional protein
MADTTAISWRSGVPVSDVYDDIYFSSESGLREASHVFLEGNNLPKRWAGIDRNFHIIETGFGTGLNFVASWKLWHENAAGHGARLYYTSIEKHPLSKNDIQLAFAMWPELSGYADEFINEYDVRHKDSLVVLLGGGMAELCLIFGDAREVLPDITTKADAWFLDGFTPAKNPDMWNDGIYKNMARLTNPGGSFATFTSVGNVRRGLQNNGFCVHKVPGFGRKRHMLVGEFMG